MGLGVSLILLPASLRLLHMAGTFFQTQHYQGCREEFKFNGRGETELPGEMHVEETDGLDELVRAGARLEIKKGAP